MAIWRARTANPDGSVPVRRTMVLPSTPPGGSAAAWFDKSVLAGNGRDLGVELDDLSEDAHAVALSRTPYVEVLVPAAYRTDGIDRALAELAPAITQHLAEGRPCL